MSTYQAKILVAGEGTGRPLILSEPLSLWGGLEPQTGEIIDQRHPQVGEVVSGKMLVMPFGKGSSSASSILLEAVKADTAPLAILLTENDGILALGAVVAQELYGASPAVVVLSGNDYKDLIKKAGSRNPQISLSKDGIVTILRE